MVDRMSYFPTLAHRTVADLKPIQEPGQTSTLILQRSPCVWHQRVKEVSRDSKDYQVSKRELFDRKHETEQHGRIGH